MSVLAAIAIFPVLTLLLVALTKAENSLGSLVEEPVTAPLRLISEAVLNDAPTGDALRVPQPQLRLVEAEERAA